MEGNEAYDGFAIDLLKEIAKYLKFKVVKWSKTKKSNLDRRSSQHDFQFKLYTVPDSLYGFYNHSTGQWNGIVRQLTDKRADLAVASMTINYARETVIDFTKPFMNLGISILFKAPKPPAAEVRS